MLFYFTGTGNSLYAAKQIEKDPLSIPQVMRGTELDFSAEQIGIVAPIYGHEVPPMVKEFLRKAQFHTDYFYMVLTYGNRHGHSRPQEDDRPCNRHGLGGSCSVSGGDETPSPRRVAAPAPGDGRLYRLRPVHQGLPLRLHPHGEQ